MRKLALPAVLALALSIANLYGQPKGSTAGNDQLKPAPLKEAAVINRDRVGNC